MRSLLPSGGLGFLGIRPFCGVCFTQLNIHPGAIPLTAFCTPNGLDKWLRMPQGAASTPACFGRVMLLVTAALDMIQMSLKDAIGLDDSPINYVATLAFFEQNSIGAARVQLLGYVISQDSVRTHDDKVAALARMPMHANVKQLRSLLDGLSYSLKPLPNIARRIRPITSLLKPQQETSFALSLRNSQPYRSLAFPDWDAMITKSRPLRLLCDASTDGLGVTLEQKQPDGSICLIVYVRRATLRQRTELDSYSTRSGTRGADYPTPSPLFIQRFLSNVREPRVPPTNKQK